MLNGDVDGSSAAESAIPTASVIVHAVGRSERFPAAIAAVMAQEAPFSFEVLDVPKRGQLVLQMTRSSPGEEPQP